MHTFRHFLFLTAFILKHKNQIKSLKHIIRMELIDYENINDLCYRRQQQQQQQEQKEQAQTQLHLKR